MWIIIVLRESMAACAIMVALLTSQRWICPIFALYLEHVVVVEYDQGCVRVVILQRLHGESLFRSYLGTELRNMLRIDEDEDNNLTVFGNQEMYRNVTEQQRICTAPYLPYRTFAVATFWCIATTFYDWKQRLASSRDWIPTLARSCLLHGAGGKGELGGGNSWEHPCYSLACVRSIDMMITSMSSCIPFVSSYLAARHCQLTFWFIFLLCQNVHSRYSIWGGHDPNQKK